MPTPQPAPRPRTRLDAETRRSAILAVAIEAFKDEDYDAVSVAGIAEKVGVSEALVFRYFPTKRMLFADVLTEAFADLRRRQVAAIKRIASHPRRDWVTAGIEVYLDLLTETYQAGQSPLLIAINDPIGIYEVRRAIRADYIRAMGEALHIDREIGRHDYALSGFYGFAFEVCRTWFERGCPADERWDVINSALGALEGALGDWG